MTRGADRLMQILVGFMIGQLHRMDPFDVGNDDYQL